MQGTKIYVIIPIKGAKEGYGEDLTFLSHLYLPLDKTSTQQQWSGYALTSHLYLLA
jgi:hypothetical protein